MQIDFYILAEHSQRDIKRMVCQLCEKATAQKMQTIIYTKSMAQAQQLDDLLWSFKAESFLVHHNTLNASEKPHHYPYPIVIQSQITDQAMTISHPFLINLSPVTPEFFQEFSRMAELITINPEEKQAARKRYRFYLDAGHQLTKYDL